MVDVKVNDLTYSGIDRIQLNKSDGTGVVNFWEAESLLKMASGTKLDYYENPYITSIPGNYITTLTNATTICFPNVVSIGRSTFALSSCYANNIILPKVTTIGEQITYSNSNPALFDFGGELATIPAYAFSGSDVKTIILRGATIPTIANLNAFNSAWKSGGTGATLYVPESLVEAYKTADVWSELYGGGAMTINAIEGSAYESTTWYKG